MTFTSCLLACCTAISSPDKTWSKTDQEALESAKGHCRVEYSRSPCLVKFKKVEDRVYQAICGKDNK